MGVIAPAILFAIIAEWKYLPGLVFVYLFELVLASSLRRRRKAKIARVIAEHAASGDDADVEGLIRQVAADRRVQGLTWDVVEVITAQLLHYDGIGRVFRMHLGDAPAIPSPIHKSFDPLPLNEEAPSTAELLEPDMGKPHTGLSRQAQYPPAHPVHEGKLARRWRNNAPPWMMVFLGIMTVVSIFETWRTNQVIFWMSSVVIGGLFIVSLLGPARHVMTTKKWYLVPGGLAVRARFGMERPVHVFDRRMSVIGMAPSGPKFRTWTVCVADGQAQHRVALSPDEVTLLLRAWLSPLRPPASDRISDLM